MSWRREGGATLGGIAAALGKGFLIACAGLTVAALFGSPPAAVAGLWTILATATAGTGCLLTAAVIRREQCAADEAVRQDIRELAALVRNLPDLEQPDPSLPDERFEPFSSRLDRERGRQAVQVR